MDELKEPEISEQFLPGRSREGAVSRSSAGATAQFSAAPCFMRTGCLGKLLIGHPQPPAIPTQDPCAHRLVALTIVNQVLGAQHRDPKVIDTFRRFHHDDGCAHHHNLPRLETEVLTK